MKIHGEPWRGAKDGDDLINFFHRRMRSGGGSFGGVGDNHKNFGHVNSKSNKIIDRAVSLRYMSHASRKVKIAVMSLLSAATWLWPYSSIKANHCSSGCGPHWSSMNWQAEDRFRQYLLEPCF